MHFGCNEFTIKTNYPSERFSITCADSNESILGSVMIDWRSGMGKTGDDDKDGFADNVVDFVASNGITISIGEANTLFSRFTMEI